MEEITNNSNNKERLKDVKAFVNNIIGSMIAALVIMSVEFIVVLIFADNAKIIIVNSIIILAVALIVLILSIIFIRLKHLRCRIICSGILYIVSVCIGTFLWCNCNKKYYIIYHRNDAVNTVDSVGYTKCSDAISLKSIERKGYIHLGWFDSKEFENIPIKNIPKGSCGNKILWAKWEAEKYKIRFNSNGGTPIKKMIYTIEDLDINLNKDSLIPRKNGCKFVGWFDNNHEKITVINENNIGEKDLEARWEEIIIPPKKDTGSKGEPPKDTTITIIPNSYFIESDENRYGQTKFITNHISNKLSNKRASIVANKEQAEYFIKIEIVKDTCKPDYGHRQTQVHVTITITNNKGLVEYPVSTLISKKIMDYNNYNTQYREACEDINRQLDSIFDKK
jgi:uncharacterized repeat protein (TIGR02543 family)